MLAGLLAAKPLTTPQRFQSTAQHNHLEPALPQQKGSHLALQPLRQ